MKKVFLMLFLATFAIGSAIAQSATTAGINTNEVIVVNPLEASMDVEFIGAYGDASTGRVSVIFRVRNKTNHDKANFGGGVPAQTAAFDPRGKTYFMPDKVSSAFVDVPNGIWVEIRLDERRLSFSNVPETTKSFELINVATVIGNSSARGMVQFRSVPIQWGVVPE